MAKKEPKIKLGSLLTALDYGDADFYSKLDKDQKVEFSPWMAMRWSSSSVSNPEYCLVMTNELVNVHFSNLNKHPELQWKLLSLCAPGTKQQRKWQPPGKKLKKSKIQAFLAELYPHMKLADLELLEQLNTKKDLKVLAEDYGYTKEEVKKIFSK